MEPPWCAWYFRGASTNLWWHQFPSSSIDNEFKLSYSFIWLISGKVCENWLCFLGSMCQFVLLLYGRLIVVITHPLIFVWFHWLLYITWCKSAEQVSRNNSNLHFVLFLKRTKSLKKCFDFLTLKPDMLFFFYSSFKDYIGKIRTGKLQTAMN